MWSPLGNERGTLPGSRLPRVGRRRLAPLGLEELVHLQQHDDANCCDYRPNRDHEENGGGNGWGTPSDSGRLDRGAALLAEGCFFWNGTAPCATGHLAPPYWGAATPPELALSAKRLAARPAALPLCRRARCLVLRPSALKGAAQGLVHLVLLLLYHRLRRELAEARRPSTHFRGSLNY